MGNLRFNPRTPCGVRRILNSYESLTILFQSTHSLRSATVPASCLLSCTLFQSTHSLRSATERMALCLSLQRMFQSTHSLRSATALWDKMKNFWPVSIHALLAECDKQSMTTRRIPACFNPRTPCGVRLFLPEKFKQSWKFQSTHSLRSATYYEEAKRFAYVVSIHALLAECDIQNKKLVDNLASFNPRTPCGVRLTNSRFHLDILGFQSTHSLRSATFHAQREKPGPYGFNPRTPCGVRQKILFLLQFIKKFQSTHSLRSATDDRLIG